MTLIDEKDELEFIEKRRKLFKAIITAIVVLLILLFVLLIYISVNNKIKLKIYLGNKELKNYDTGLILKNNKGKIVEENGEIYFSAQKLAAVLNYQFYNGVYKKKSEELTQCQIKINNQITSYSADSNKIYKTILYENENYEQEKNRILGLYISEDEKAKQLSELVKYNEEYEYFEIPNSVKYIDNTIYISKKAVELGFDLSIGYDSKNKSIKILTLDNLEKIASEKRSKDYLESSKYDYLNKRLLKYGMVIVKEPNTENIGVGNYIKKDKLDSFVASCKYSRITFNEGTSTLECISANDGKKCILELDLNNQEVKRTMTTHYNDIKAIDKNFEYFVVKDKNKFGMINSKGNIILNPIFDDMGVNENLYNDIQNKYIINDKYIPVKQDGVWGLYNIESIKLIEPKYADIGCSINQSGDGVIIVPNIKNNEDGVVFKYNGDKNLYGIYNISNGNTIAISLVEVFKKTEDNELHYYANHTINIEDSIIHTLDIHKDI